MQSKEFNFIKSSNMNDFLLLVDGFCWERGIGYDGPGTASSQAGA